jgi:hypothetical protein
MVCRLIDTIPIGDNIYHATHGSMNCPAKQAAIPPATEVAGFLAGSL